MNSRLLLQELRTALDMYEMQQMGYAPGTMPAEERIAHDVVSAILPTLKSMPSLLSETNGAWISPRNKITEKIQTALLAGTDLAGYDPRDWMVWGVVLAAYNAFLDSPITIEYPDGQGGTTTETTTAREVINTVFTKVVP